MKFSKSWLLSFLMITMFSFSAIAGTSYSKEPVSINKQFKKLLKNLDTDDLSEDTIYIDFMVNAKAEIIVLSTTSKEIDKTLKSKLNYKTIQAGNLELFKKYTIPVTFTQK